MNSIADHNRIEDQIWDLEFGLEKNPEDHDGQKKLKRLKRALRKGKEKKESLDDEIRGLLSKLRSD